MSRGKISLGARRVEIRGKIHNAPREISLAGKKKRIN